ncbi:MAG: hypothetical protein EOP54_14790, partial [Sphingobacteriales bacterium]
MSIKINSLSFNKLQGLFLAGLLTTSLQAFSQNMPNIVEAVVPGTIATGGGAPVPDYDNNFYPSGMRRITTIVPRQRDTTSVNYHPWTNPISAKRTVNYLAGGGKTIQSIVPAFSRTDNQYNSLYSATDDRTTVDRYTFQAFPINGNVVDYEQNALYWSEDYHNTSFKYPEEGAANLMRGVSAGRLTNSSTPSERSYTTFMPGLSRIGQNRGVKTSLVINKAAQSTPNTEELAAYNIKIWDIGSNGLPVSTATYPAGSLNGTVTISPDGSYKWIFANEVGNPVYEATLIKIESTVTPPNMVTTTPVYAYTYYVYDDMNNLRFVLPPKAVSYARSNGWNISSGVLAELCFAYAYDAKGRQYAVHKPGEA